MQSVCGLHNDGKSNQFPKHCSLPNPLNLINTHRSRPTSSNNFKNNSSREDNSYFKSDFDFKFVSKIELETILKRVRREKQKQQDVENWNNFVKSRLEEITDKTIKSSSNLYSAPNETATCAECGLLTPKESIYCQSSRHQEESMGIEENVDEEKIIPPPNFRTVSIDANTSDNYQLGPGLTKRLQDLLATIGRMTTVLLSPCLRSQNEDEDVDRTIKRSIEFDAMFSRNHLYEIQRLLKDTKQMMTFKSTPAAELENKISAMLKSISQALQVYTKHVSKGSRVKYQQVVPIFQSIAIAQSMLENLSGQRLFPMRQELDVSCSYMKQILLEISATETRSVTTVSHKTPKVRARHKPSADLSMYNRRQREWRRKSATLARAKFGPPGTKKQYKKPQSAALKDGDHHTHVSSEQDVAGSNINNRVSVGQPKELANSKDIPFRNATRAVPEEHVATMMEMIPQEEQLENTILEDKEDKFIEKSENKTTNVQLLYVREGIDTRQATSTQDTKKSEQPVENEIKTLYMMESEKAKSLEYQKKIADYQQISPLYKDDKALGIVDRLASRILKEMLLDFQSTEMDQVIQTLYDLEFE